MNNSKITIILLSFITSLLIILISLPHIPHTTGDALNYIKAAEHGPYGIIRPHGSRFLLPALVRTMKPFMNVHQGFFFMGTLSLIFFITIILVFLNIFNIPLLFGCLILFNPLLVTYYSQYYIPDIFYMALLSAYFILIFYNKQYLSSSVLTLLFFTRETTIILCIIVIIISIYKKNKNQLILTILSSLLGFSGLAIIKQFIGTNIWGIPEIVYLIVKAPVNILVNLGIGIYTNVVPYCDPMFIINLPTKYHMGRITSIGPCKWNPFAPVEICSMFLTLFGVGPIILYYFIYKRFYLGFIKTNWFIIVFYYGIFIYLLGFIISCDRLRVIGYGWPIFWLIIPIWLFLYYSREDLFKLKPLLIIHIIICWIPFTLIKLNSALKLNYKLLTINFIVLFITIILYVIGWSILNKSNLFKLNLSDE